MSGPLDACVHCGFCLPACPTYLATGDESDSPRGRIMLMRALDAGELGPEDPGLVQHLDACLGCRGCEPVCPSGVAYGRGLEAARERLARARGFPAMTRGILGVFRRRLLWRPLFALARVLRRSGLPGRLAGGSPAGFQLGMLASTAPAGLRTAPGAIGAAQAAPPSVSRPTAAGRPPADAAPRPRVALFRGCIMDGLFRHVHDATRRTLEANGYTVVEPAGQVCCGALHEHAGDRSGAAALARRNLATLRETADWIVVNSAGCGALLKDYGHLLGGDEAAAFAARVRDVTELLAAAGPRPGGPLPLEVAYDPPCHLLHAQGVADPPLRVLSVIDGLRLRVLPGAERCCGSAGIYGVLHPAMARAVLDDKLVEVARAEPPVQVLATGNPGCQMHIGAGLRAAGLDAVVVHPVELLDRAYRAAGVYDD